MFFSSASFLRMKLSNQTLWLLVGPLGLRWECISAHFFVNVKANIISSVCAEIGLFSGPIGWVSFHHWEKLTYFNSTLKAALIQLDSGCMFIQICSDSGFPLPYCLILVYFFVISVKGSERGSVRLWLMLVFPWWEKRWIDISNKTLFIMFWRRGVCHAAYGINNICYSTCILYISRFSN